MKKILVLGADGMAGHIITLYLLETNRYDVHDFCHTRKIRKKSQIIDVMNLDIFNEKVDSINPEIIINCTGILNEKCDQDYIKASYINAFFPQYLVNKFKNTSCKVIHLSTDSVFDGEKGSYDEQEIKNPTTIYGITKGMGEFDNSKDLTIRTSLVGPDIKDGPGLLNWFMKQEDAIDGYQNVLWTGITNLELARIIDIVIEKEITGLYNIVPNDKISKYELLNIMKKVFNKENIKIYPEVRVKSDRSLITKRKDLDYEIKNYSKMMEELYEWMLNHPKYYQRYFGQSDKIIVVWSKIKAETVEKEKREEWIKHRIKIFMKYTLVGFKNQTNQDFYYFINYDEYAKPYVTQELKKYPPLPSNIIFTDHYYVDIEKKLPYYKTMYFVRIDSDDMYQKDYLQKLKNYHHKEATKSLLVLNGYIYDAITDELARWIYKAPPFYTLIYDCFDFSNGYRHNIHGTSSVFINNYEIIYGDNFIVIAHHKNTVTVFNCSFRKQVVEGSEKARIKLENNLNVLE
ncbi:MAG: sugar nucleotide-binding protein [Bacilli bacterium]|nr:sugar nucleotide-binding protein [Bacilli bacterium]